MQRLPRRAICQCGNPARLDYVRANDVCIQCHSQGQPLANPIQGKYYDWPVGFHVGQNKLNDVWKLEEHQLGETSFTHLSRSSEKLPLSHLAGW